MRYFTIVTLVFVASQQALAYDYRRELPDPVPYEAPTPCTTTDWPHSEPTPYVPPYEGPDPYVKPLPYEEPTPHEPLKPHKGLPVAHEKLTPYTTISYEAPEPQQEPTPPEPPCKPSPDHYSYDNPNLEPNPNPNLHEPPSHEDPTPTHPTLPISYLLPTLPPAEYTPQTLNPDSYTYTHESYPDPGPPAVTPFVPGTPKEPENPGLNPGLGADHTTTWIGNSGPYLCTQPICTTVIPFTTLLPTPTTTTFPTLPTARFTGAAAGKLGGSPVVGLVSVCVILVML
ncbi:hypothetical protein HYALB_00010968 [Hymenoscyphus albidus]|uniref:Uncharacterized protein n=1 Tax=Hymenoscyphus albidus TaxID=595503 RepID=A0A9N9LU55_9HELO|nr:hypothetical protein HYALB_00010968 [Hymenoscyphus albidus]